MSQYSELDEQDHVSGADSQNDFDAGFDAAEEKAPESGELPEGWAQKSGEVPSEGNITAPPEEIFSHEAAGESFPAAEAESSPTTPEIKNIEVPEELADELEALKQLNPQAAEVAQEDSPEGESVRRRLAELGALAAQDRAENILERRERAKRAEQAEAERNRQAIEAHNRRFMSVLQHDHPDYTAMLADPTRKLEAARYMEDVLAWISAKPYAEAAPLMEIARHGRNPEQVSALLTQYRQERGKAAPRKSGPEGAFAVPARGAASAPSGDEGNADDFDAGFNLE